MFAVVENLLSCKIGCWRKMLHTIFLYFVLATQYLFYGATPLSGRDVNKASLGEKPYIVSLSHHRKRYQLWRKLVSGEESNHFCGGSLITTKHILTAAHCLLNKKYHDVVAKVGSINLRNAETYKVEMWVTYHEWASIEVPEKLPMSVYDVAVVKLRHSVNIDTSIIPEIAFIPKENLYGRTIVTGGWGHHEGTKISRYMRITKFFINFPEKCHGFKQKDRYLVESLETMYLCATASGARADCGDSGNPILFDNKIVAVISKSCETTSGPTVLSQESFFSSLDYDPRFISEVLKK